MRKNRNRRGFYNHLNTIKNVEADKDAFLRASKLQRHERQPRFDSDHFFALLLMGMFMAFILILILFG